ncbi:ImmA/IrrE family metallo-endopeptidase [Pseudomonas aeruginosa]|uniref:ImmA/IrrE family metallo-endopeptidase n=1 Tax=Pseudomonas aeruginosa TaxID=287 RepID=UPI000449359E|nr:ImmA/IrrE family metallo-endopeptidase [Pseudomonas aeruginosa]AUA81052.1 ImmA/IrrE family metallo-endopeptidase [Pseudomonas aeruginosa]AUA87136.1 ImmA/IrrE family metallo-endopeptidase [Pseudomonas aeruginosa]ELC3005613.1 ImmA/IrrE family metallo-endopeptidase [Pseudomonas aeruginosa]ELF6907603.1 ImmA/IrrE family metallo-endopeptidase [Pseudomonas aeruginosa]EZO18030.1 hypothetical protein AJ62_05575 [Pseudomonas aeruginosa 3575]
MSSGSAGSIMVNQKALVMKGMQAAIATRKDGGQDQKSPICIYGLCEQLGVTVRFNDINMEGMYDKEPKPRIHVTALRPIARRNFTCAHELGHHVFGHGSTIDELKDDQSRLGDNSPNEVLADSFAAFMLMPTMGLREAFAKRGLDPNKASALDIYAVACNFGVGQATLVNHLAYGIDMISAAQRERLGKITPKRIRAQILGDDVAEHLTLADSSWTSSTLDTEEANLIVMPSGVIVDTSILQPIRDLSTGRLFRAMKAGITRVTVPGTPWATYVRIARKRYTGLARYRHLEDTDDE